ncbi:unnamed protein product [Thelazia callipaeda]|uniref:Cytochrome c oxidase subunit VIa n=1 Tax=Thelazia callipaeda TaxID=103827 RepID=A0A0N5CXL7_THECL|nr:unnamed protein product [Thelazia callipaeda]
MSQLLCRLLSVTRGDLTRIRLNAMSRTFNTGQVRRTQVTTDYDEEADDRDRFKYDKYYNAAVAVGTPIMLSILIYMAYLGHTLEEHFDQDKYINYPYLTIRRNPLPWGDGNHALFHNKEKNYVPGVGFEKKQEKHH